MADKIQYWTSPRKDGSWVVKKIGASRPTSIHNSQSVAWKEARRLARGSGSEALLKGKDGKIQARNIYDNDI